MKDKLAFSYLLKMVFVISLFFISPLQVFAPYMMKVVENSERLHSCLIIDGPILNQWKN